MYRDSLDLKDNLTEKRVDFVLINCHKLSTKCDILYFKKDLKFWIKKPEIELEE